MLFSETNLLLDLDLAVNQISAVPDQFLPGKDPALLLPRQAAPPVPPSGGTLGRTHRQVVS